MVKMSSQILIKLIKFLISEIFYSKSQIIKYFGQKNEIIFLPHFFRLILLKAIKNITAYNVILRNFFCCCKNKTNKKSQVQAKNRLNSKQKISIESSILVNLIVHLKYSIHFKQTKKIVFKWVVLDQNLLRPII